MQDANKEIRTNGMRNKGSQALHKRQCNDGKLLLVREGDDSSFEGGHRESFKQMSKFFQFTALLTLSKNMAMTRGDTLLT